MSRTTVEICHAGLVLEVEVSTWLATRGARDSLGGRPGAGPPLEPDEPAGFDIEKITVKDIDDVDAIYELVEAELIEQGKDDGYESY